RAYSEALYAVHAEARVERRRCLRDGALGRDIVVVLWRVLHLETLALQPGLHRAYLCLRGGEALAELLRSEVLPIGCGVWVGARPAGPFGRGWVCPGGGRTGPKHRVGGGGPLEKAGISPTRNPPLPGGRGGAAPPAGHPPGSRRSRPPRRRHSR